MTRATPMAGQALSQEAQLLDYAQRLNRHRAGRRAVHIHLSKLRPYNRRAQHLRIATNTFETLVRAYEGQIFSLANADIVFIAKGASQSDIDGAVLRLRYLFSEDPVIQNDDPHGPDRFCTWYDIENGYEAFLTAMIKIVAMEEARRASTAQPARPASPPPPQSLDPLVPDQLARIEQSLARADLTNVIRRQPVCAMPPGALPQPVFQELFVSITDLQRVVAPKTNLASNRWLFQHLTETLDRRLLAALPRMGDSSIESRFSINLNVATILSEEFLAFDASVKSTARGTLVIELQMVDVFADMGSYLFARDFVRERGYRLCLDGLSYLTAPLVDRDRLGLDFIKIFWSPSMADDAKGRRVDELKEMIHRAGEARVIFCRCDHEDAVRLGRSLGITLFQGRHIDGLLATKKAGPPFQSRP